MTATTAEQMRVELSLQSLIDLRFEVQRLRSTKATGGRDFPGHRLAKRRGQGIEFLDLRPYVNSDDVRHIDWNVTARTNEPHTRLYQQEREQSTTVIADLRTGMFNGSDCLRAVSVGRLAAATLWQAANAGDRCASMVISSAGTKASRPLPGNRGVLQALELIASGFEQTAVLAGKKRPRQQPQLSDALTTIVNNRRHTGRYLLFSGFDTDGDDQFDQALLSSAALRRLSAILVLDNLELHELPPGNYRYQHQQQANRVIITRSAQGQLKTLLNDELNRKRSALAAAGIDTIEVTGTSSTADFLMQLQRWI